MKNSTQAISQNVDSIYQIFSIMKKVIFNFLIFHKYFTIKIGSFRKFENIF